MTSPGTDDLVLSVESHGAAVVLAVSGEIDIVTAPQFRAAIERELQTEPAELVIDLSEISFLASAGLGVLAACGKPSDTETKVKVVAHGPITARPIHLTGLDQVLDVYPTRAEALTV